jgi:very-short-patch-repair endonuclease
VKKRISWNKGKKGLSGKDHPMYGRKHSEESKRKMSKSSKGKISSFKGKKHTTSANRKNRLAHLGKKASPETRRKMREAHKRRIVTSAWRKNISRGLSGKKKSRQHRKNLSEARKGIKPWNKGKKFPRTWVVKPHSRLSKLRNRRSHLGKNATAETRKKMSLAHKGKQTGKTNPMFGKKHSEKSVRQYKRTMKKKYPDGFKMTEQQKKKIAKKYKPQKPSKNTKIEKIIQSLCRRKKIKFQTQKRFEFEVPPPHYHSVDLFIQPNICVECDGDRFHANPKKYAPNDIIYRVYKSKHHHRKKPLMAKQIWKKDKHITQELRKQGNRVIRLWGSEINSNPEKCLQKIKKAIKK